MKMLATLAVLATTVALGSAQGPKGHPLCGDTFKTALGADYQLPAGAPGLVILFLGHDCPISNSYSKEIARIRQDYEAKKIAFCLVYADADVTPAAAKKHATEYGLAAPVLLDPGQVLARKVGATIMPEAAVIGPKGEVLYLGRIDDRYIDFGKRREQLTSTDLRLALDELLAGKPISKPRVAALGCDIDFKKPMKK